MATQAGASAADASSQGPPSLPALLTSADPAGADLLLSALAAASASYRRATCTTPFPSALFEGANGRDHAALLANLQSLPPAAQLGAATGDGRLSSQQAALALWALSRPRRPVGGVRRCTLRQVQEQMPSLTGWVADIGHNPSLRPQAVLQLSAVPPALAAGDSRTRLLAFHGTGMENMWSILNNGLLNASGTRLERTGAAFGKGIYFSTELPVAFSFCQPADGWAGSALGRRLRCLLVCSIDREHAQGAHNSSEVPDRYIVVERMDAVQMHFVFLYLDDSPGGTLPPGSPLAAGAGAAGGQQQQQQQQPGGVAQPAAAAGGRTSPLVYLLAAYAGWMLFLAVRDHWPWIRRWARRQFGLRI